MSLIATLYRKTVSNQGWGFIGQFYEAAALHAKPDVDDFLTDFLDYVDKLECDDSKEAALLMLLKKLGEFHVYPSLDVAQRTARLAGSLGYTVNHTRFDNRGLLELDRKF